MNKIVSAEMLVGKAATSATADTAFLLLNNDQIRTFLRLVKEGQDVMIADSRVINVQAPELDLANIDIADGQMAGGIGATTRLGAGDEITPEFDGVNLAPEPYECRLEFEMTRLPLWNIEGAGLERTMDEILATYYFSQLEEVAIHGDTAGANPAGYATGMMTTTNGWITTAINDCHVYDHGGGYVRPHLFETLLGSIPVKWIGSETERAQFRFYVPSAIERQYRYWLTNRGTNLGDLSLTADGQLAYAGIPMVAVPKMHTDDAGVLTQSATLSGLSYVLLCKPQNKLLGVNPPMRVFKHPRDDGKTMYINLYGEYDTGFYNVDEVAVAVNVVPTVNPSVVAV